MVRGTGPGSNFGHKPDPNLWLKDIKLIGGEGAYNTERRYISTIPAVFGFTAVVQFNESIYCSSEKPQ